MFSKTDNVNAITWRWVGACRCNLPSVLRLLQCFCFIHLLLCQVPSPVVCRMVHLSNQMLF